MKSKGKKGEKKKTYEEDGELTEDQIPEDRIKTRSYGFLINSGRHKG